MTSLLLSSILLLVQASTCQLAKSPNETQYAEAHSQEIERQVRIFADHPDSSCVSGAEFRSPDAQNRTCSANCDDSFTHTISTINAVFSGAIVLLTILIWKVYRQQLASAHVTERAWIISEVQDVTVLNKNPILVFCKVINSGRTPAWVKKTGSRGQVLRKGKESDLPQAPPPCDLISPFTDEGSPLPPHSHLTHIFAIPQPNWIAVENEEATLYIWGFAEYRDVYGNDHITRYCYVYQPSKDDIRSRDFYIGGPKGYNEAS
jgi:hypothetical protein